MPERQLGPYEEPLSLADLKLRNEALAELSRGSKELADTVSTSLLVTEEVYKRLPHNKLWLVISISEVLRALSLPQEEWGSTTDWPRELGRRRAAQGIPLESQARKYNIMGHVLFAALLQAVGSNSPTHDRAAPIAAGLWGVVDLHRAAAATALKERNDELSGNEQAGLLLDQLLGGETDPGVVRGVASAQGWDAGSNFVVTVMRPSWWGANPVDATELSQQVAGLRMTWRVANGSAVGVTQVGDVPAPQIAADIPTLPERRTGVSPAVEGLAELGRARRLAELAVRTVTGSSGVACLEERLPAALLAERPDLVRGLSQRVLGPVLALDRINRDLLLDAFDAWLQADGSTLHAASALYCHRNTVLNRLRRLERLTKRSLQVPRDLTELKLALEAFRLGQPGR